MARFIVVRGGAGPRNFARLIRSVSYVQERLCIFQTAVVVSLVSNLQFG